MFHEWSERTGFFTWIGILVLAVLCLGYLFIPR